MFSPLFGYTEREKFGMFAVQTTLSSGTAVDVDPAGTAPFAASVYGANYGNVVAASCTYTFTQSGTTPFAVTGIEGSRELGWLEQPVTTSGPSLLEILSQVYDESVPEGANAVVVTSKAGALIATDQIVASPTTGYLDLTSAVANPPGTICGIANGLVRKQQAGDVPRLKLIAAVTQRTILCGAFQIL